MELSVWVSLVALAVSGVAAGLSAFLARQQVRLARRNVNLAGLLTLMDEFRKPEFHNNYRYVTEQLQVDHPPTAECGIFDLPDPAYSCVIDVAYFYQSCASYAGYGLVDERIIMAFVHLRLVAVWQSVEPYVVVERNKSELTGPHFLGLLETYARRARSISSDAAMEGLPTSDVRPDRRARRGRAPTIP